MRAMRFCLLLLALLAPALAGLVGSSPVAAQNTVAVDYQAWDTVARLAESAVERASASDDLLTTLRAQVVNWRDRFTAAEGTNAVRIETLREQIGALGDAPSEGVTEAPEIAQRRTELNNELAAALAPVRRAEEAGTQAESIIRQIDTLIRNRQATQLLSFGGSPLNLARYPEAFGDLTDSTADLINESNAKISAQATRDALRRNAPQIGFYLILALVCLMRGRRWTERLTQIVLDRFSGRVVRLAAFLTSLLQVLVPLLGIYLLVEAVQLTGFLGELGGKLIGVLPLIGVALFGARWLALRLLPSHPKAPRSLPARPERDGRFRLYVIWLGALVSQLWVLDVLAQTERYSSGTVAVLYFPVFVLFGLTYWRIGRNLSTPAGEVLEETDSPTFGLRGQRLVGQGLVLIGVAIPIASAIGYQNFAYFLALPTALSLALLGLLRVLYDIVVEIFAVITARSTDDAREALIPTLISFGLVLLSLPIFALIWGARVAEITEIWARIREGFAIGDTVISPASLLIFAVIFGALYAGTRLFQSALRSSVLSKTKLDQGAQTAIVSGTGYLGIALAGIIAVTTAGIDLSGLALVAGALSVGIGFGLQNIVSNFISGIILLVERPVAEGDWIEVGGHMGIVKDISVRSTRIETFDKNDVIVPNADFISGAVKNWTRGNLTGRIVIPVGVAYGTDTRKVVEILQEVAMDHPLVSLNPEPAVDFLDFGASSLDFQIRAILPDIGHGMSVRTEIRHQIMERFAAEGIEMPFPQRDLWIKNPDALARPGSD